MKKNTWAEVGGGPFTHMYIMPFQWGLEYTDYILCKRVTHLPGRVGSWAWH